MTIIKKVSILIVLLSMVFVSSANAELASYIETKDGEKVLVRTVDDYSSTGNYLHSDKMSVEKRDVTFDENGIPMFKFRWGTYYYPITIAQYGLQHHALYLVKNDQESYKKLISTANYFIETQDSKGGWPIEFDHMFYKGRTEEIKGPWYSAMAQGQAMSVLVRAYDLTKNKKYLEAAIRGMNLYTIPVESGGVMRKFENKYLFFEEYPTEPASYVLNGFMYSLFGLYDVYKISGDKQAEKLYKEGIKSLKRMISLYDLGNRSAYDLTHYTTEGNPPNIARWGYHSTHILELSAIYAIEKDIIFKNVLDRWINYVKGMPAKTN